MSQNYNFETLASDPSLLLYDIDFKNFEAHFYYAKPELTARHCGAVLQNQPLYKVPLRPLIEETDILEKPLPRPVNIIWITEYTGSTLFANALEATSKFHLYNETAVFARLSLGFRAALFGDMMHTLPDMKKLAKIILFFQSKTMHSGEHALVKEWPLSSYIAPYLLDADEQVRGIFFYASLEDFLTASTHRPIRLDIAKTRVTQRFQEVRHMPAFADVDFENRTPGEYAALYWLAILYEHQRTGLRDHKRIKTLHNETFFAKPAKTLHEATAFFGKKITRAQAEQTSKSSLFSRHAKQPHRAFSDFARKEVLKVERIRNRQTIEEGLAVAAQILVKFPLDGINGQGLLR